MRVTGWGVENGVTAYSPVTRRISSRKGSEGREGSPGGGCNGEQVQRGENYFIILLKKSICQKMKLGKYFIK